MTKEFEAKIPFTTTKELLKHDDYWDVWLVRSYVNAEAAVLTYGDTPEDEIGFSAADELANAINESHGEPVVYKGAYSLSGKYIGTPETAQHLLDEYGIKEFYAIGDNEVVSVGFNPDTETWYGWSHRAIWGFQVGSEVQKGDSAYQPVDLNDYIERLIDFYTFDDYVDRTEYKIVPSMYEKNKEAVEIIFHYNDKVPNDTYKNSSESKYFDIPEEWGKGEWKAETLDDAKQMAIDFANAVA